MVTLTKIDPKDIPEVSNKYLMRGADRKAADQNGKGSEDDGDGNDQRGRARNRSDAKEKSAYDKILRNKIFSFLY